MSREGRVTLLRPPPADPNKAPIENELEVTELAVLGPDIFTNTRQARLPPGARGIYGGSVIAQCLASAYKTVAENFVVHSCHCYFLLAGAPTIPILFHVERVRDGRSFATRTVQARQRGRCIFTTTISFVRSGSGGSKLVQHAAALPEGVAETEPPNDWNDSQDTTFSSMQKKALPILGAGDASVPLNERKTRQWLRVKGQVSAEGGTQAHLNALAYMTDSFFIGTVARVHGLWRYGVKPEDVGKLPEKQRAAVERAMELEGIPREDWATQPKLGMMVSLDHSVYFHEPLRVRADEWMYSEMDSPWAGEGRGFVRQSIFARDGTLLATCVQEGVVRLEDEGTGKDKKPSKL